MTTRDGAGGQFAMAFDAPEGFDGATHRWSLDFARLASAMEGVAHHA